MLKFCGSGGFASKKLEGMRIVADEMVGDFECDVATEFLIEGSIDRCKTASSDFGFDLKTVVDVGWLLGDG